MNTLKTYYSPNKDSGFDLIFQGGIRFGPEYFRLKLDGQVVRHRTFGNEFTWHPNSELLAFQEWLTTDYKKVPITSLTLIQPKTRKFARISVAKGGFIIPKKFEDEKIIFEKKFLGKGKTSEFEINLNEIKNWEDE